MKIQIAGALYCAPQRHFRHYSCSSINFSIKELQAVDNEPLKLFTQHITPTDVSAQHRETDEDCMCMMTMEQHNQHKWTRRAAQGYHFPSPSGSSYELPSPDPNVLLSPWDRDTRIG